MEISTNNLMKILLPQDNKTLVQALKNSDSQQLSTLLNNKNISSQEILKNIFEQLKNPDKSNTSLLNFLKNSNFFKDLGSFSNNISTLLETLKSNENLESFTKSLENFSKQMKDIDARNLESNIKNSGIYLESKLATFNKNNKLPILEDLKNIILKLQDEITNSKSANEQKSNNDLNKLVDKLLMQIETSQIFSLLSNSNYVYIPFVWDMLEDGNIEVLNSKEDDFYCKINLTLKDFGIVELTLGISDDTNFEIYANFENENFKELFTENIEKLKEGFSKQGISINLLRINSLNEINKNQEVYKDNTYDKYSNLLNQIDIKA